MLGMEEGVLGEFLFHPDFVIYCPDLDEIKLY